MKALPTQKQLKYLDWEFGAFFHFGIRSFHPGHRDWDGIPMDASTFCPDALDCGQWVRTVKSVGAKYAIMTAKHHDGFALWPSAFTDYSVAASPWKDGKGDVVREFTDACRKEGIAVGLYYSPAQWKKPDEMPASVGAPEKPMWGAVSAVYEDDRAYDDYFIGQISELLTNYGKIDYLWFDGCGSGDHQYDQKRIIGTIRSLQPDILIFGMWDPDTEWVGNEDGYAPVPNYYTQTRIVLGEEKTYFVPAECDCRIRTHWFYDNDEWTLKSVDELVGMFELSVGRGSNLLLNIGPDDHGLLPESDIRRLRQWRAELDRRYGTPLPFAPMAKNAHGSYSIEYTDETLNSHLGDTDYIPLCRSVILKEDLTNGQSVKRFKLCAHLPSRQPISDRTFCVFEGETIGHKCICRFPAVRAPKFTLEILESDGEPVLTEFCAFE